MELIFVTIIYSVQILGSTYVKSSWMPKKNAETAYKQGTYGSINSSQQNKKELIDTIDDSPEVQQFMNLISKHETNKASTIVSITDEAQYYEWGKNWPQDNIEADPIMMSSKTPSTITKRVKFKKLREIMEYAVQNNDPSILDDSIFYKINNNVLSNHSKTLNEATNKTKQKAFTFNDDEMDEYNKNDIKMPVDFGKHEKSRLPEYDLNHELLSPPRIKYEDMKLRDETGREVFLEDSPDLPHHEYHQKKKHTPNIQSRFQYPQARERWWWEYEKHFMHWYFWHCWHWMTFWKIHPPVSTKPRLRDFDRNFNEQEGYRNQWSYNNSKEYYYYNYCNWLLHGKSRNKRLNYEYKLRKDKDNIFNDIELHAANLDYINGPNNTKSRAVKALKSEPFYTVGECFYCGRQQINGVPTTRLCHRAFTNKEYFKFQKYLVAECCHHPWTTADPSRTFVKGIEEYVKGKLGLRAHSSFYNKSCFKHYTDVGELYTERGCRMNVFISKRTTRLHVRSLYDALDLTILDATTDGCVASPYSAFIPFTRSKAGLFVRAYACICSGNFCNSACIVNGFTGFSYLTLFILNLIISRYIL